jgi:uncharacterized protein
MLGTLFNFVAVLIGATIGSILGERVPKGWRDAAFMAIGVFTLGLGMDMATPMTVPLAVFTALILGGITGHLLGWMKKPSTESSRSASDSRSAAVKATLLFCAGAMTLVGCMEEGVHGDSTLLLTKSAMDFISSIFLAAALGRGVIWSAVAVLIIQGGLTGFFSYSGDLLSSDQLAGWSEIGGLLILALGIDLLGIKRIPVAGLLPALLWIFLTLPATNWLTAFFST